MGLWSRLRGAFSIQYTSRGSLKKPGGSPPRKVKARGGSPPRKRGVDRHKKGRLQIRMEKGLIDDFKHFCGERGVYPSELLELYIREILREKTTIKILERQLRKNEKINDLSRQKK
jgi:hypothetical protein